MPPGITLERTLTDSVEPLDFADFYGVWFNPLCVQLHAHTGSLIEAQDVVQEAFCRALVRWPRISQYDDPVAWVRKVAWNIATSRWRRARTGLAFVHRQREEHTPEPDPARVDLLAALATLPPRQRQAVVLHYFSDVPVVEIAHQMGAAEGTVKSWLHRARTTLDGQLRVLDPLPQVRPPGVEAARRAVRRRRDRNALLAVIALVSLAIATFVLPRELFRTPAVEPSPTPSPTLQPTPTASAVAQAPATGTPSAGPSCTSLPMAVGLKGWDPTNIQLGFWDARARSYDPKLVMCPGVTLRIRWAEYSIDGLGTMRLQSSGSLTMDNAHPTRSFSLAPDTRCAMSVVTATDVPLPPTIDKAWYDTTGVGSPFWDARIGLRSQVAYTTLGVCPSPAPTP
jgi:RNA polymerase sigma-70 factor, ECF subfamily